MSLEDLRKHRCIETIAPKSDWFVRIGHRLINFNYLKNEDIWNREVLEHKAEYTTSGMGADNLSLSSDNMERNLIEIIEEDAVKNFDFVQRECLKTPMLILKLGQSLSGRAIDILWTKILKKRNVKEEFVEIFYKYFFTTFLRRPYTWYSLHILIKASKGYPNNFRSTMKVLLKDKHITSGVLQDYVEHLNNEDCTILMKFVAEIPFTLEEFDHIVSVIYVMYVKSHKTDSTFNFIHTNLNACKSYCAYNKNYGRLLLYFIQNVAGHEVRMRDLEAMVEYHCTPYKSLCMACLDKFERDIMALQMGLHGGNRIVIPRPSDDIRL